MAEIFDNMWDQMQHTASIQANDSYCAKCHRKLELVAGNLHCKNCQLTFNCIADQCSKVWLASPVFNRPPMSTGNYYPEK